MGSGPSHLLAEAHGAARAAAGGPSPARESSHAGQAGGLGRRQLGRWTAQEVAALLEGVQVHGTHWAAIYDAYVGTGRINPGRTKVPGWEAARGLQAV